ncbi:MAG: GWxTD domain-containing protein [Fidelibacterota bacterium]
MDPLLLRIVAVVVITLLSPLAPSPLPGIQTDGLRIDTDVAQFRYRDGENYVEIYYAFDVSDLTYEQEDDHLQGGLLLHGAVASPGDQEVIVNRVWSIPHQVADSTQLESVTTVVGVIGLTVPEGTYTLTVESFDLNDTSRKHVNTHDLPFRSFMGEDIALSDVELCSSIGKATDTTPSSFYKNTLEVVPNPGRIYGGDLPSLDYYVEAYNFLVSPDILKFYTTAKVYDPLGNELVSQERSRPRLHESSVEVGSIDVSSLDPGSYLFEFSVVDPASDSRVTSRKEFYVYGPRRWQEEAILWASGYAGMNEKDLDREFDLARYVALDTETALYEDLISPGTKRRFLFEFWKKRDSDPKTFENEYKEEFMQRVEVANARFRTANKEGWQTDRGRVYIVYGPPDEYERHDSGPMTKPYEVWYYNDLQGGVHFVFADLFGFRDYILLHSTHRSELRDDTWQQQIREN